MAVEWLTTETQRTQRLHRESLLNLTQRQVEFSLIEIYQWEIGRGETTCCGRLAMCYQLAQGFDVTVTDLLNRGRSMQLLVVSETHTQLATHHRRCYIQRITLSPMLTLLRSGRFACSGK